MIGQKHLRLSNLNSVKTYSRNCVWERTIKNWKWNIATETLQVLQYISDVRWFLTLIRVSKLSFVNEGNIATSSNNSTHTTLKWTVPYNRTYSTRPRSVFNQRLCITKISKRHGWFSEITMYGSLHTSMKLYIRFMNLYELYRKKSRGVVSAQ